MRKWIVGTLATMAIVAVVATLAGVGFCNDGWVSQSIGKQGAWSWHGGVMRVLS